MLIFCVWTFQQKKIQNLDKIWKSYLFFKNLDRCLEKEKKNQASFVKKPKHNPFLAHPFYW